MMKNHIQRQFHKMFKHTQQFVGKPSRPNTGRKEKIKLNVSFQTSLWCLKKFYESLYENLLRHHKEVGK